MENRNEFITNVILKDNLYSILSTKFVYQPGWRINVKQICP